MTWVSFVDFWIMRELGTEDSVMRNYDITRMTGEGSTHLWLALKRIGVPCTAKDHENYVPEVRARLVAIGVPEPPLPQVRIRLIAWYNWDRIRKGEVGSWFLSEMVHNARG
jgi:hypothetical protein